MDAKTKRLHDRAWKAVSDASALINSKTAENELVLFTEDQIETNDDLLNEMPYGFFIDKHGFYIEGKVQRIFNGDVELFLTGEDYGEKHLTTLDELPVESLLYILHYLK